MLILLNPNAAGGLALKKWTGVRERLEALQRDFELHFLRDDRTTKEVLHTALTQNETDYIAAGGDGTVNCLLNSLLTLVTNADLKRMRLGAIGIGSSNDFHKPIAPEKMISGIPVAIDLEAASPRDIACVEFEHNSHIEKRYFLSNASIGVTAEANNFFNRPDWILRKLKQSHTGSAIHYAALLTLAKFRNFDVTISCPEKGELKAHLTNLGVVKNPHFSGNLRYGASGSSCDGQLVVHLAQDLSKLSLLSLLRALSGAAESASEFLETWQTRSLLVTAEQPFAVEYDGEVVETTRARFTVLPKYLKVCQ